MIDVAAGATGHLRGTTTMIELERDGAVFVLRMTAGENRFNRAFLDALDAALDEVEAGAPAALVTTGEGKFYSNGLDLDWLATAGSEAFRPFIVDVEALFARVLAMPVITVAAVNGHVFAAGAMLALAHDFRVMRADRGFFCLPEVDIDIPFTPGMSAMITARLPVGTAHEAMVTGRRYGGTAAAAAGIVHDAVAEDEVIPHATAIAAGLATKRPATVGAIKQELYRDVLAKLIPDDT